ncbi:MAG: heavy-metal-associated domain-containing protein, partial [Desulfuromonadales bacterium]|nr:heavy-metal-associated domain-containing protein [Desulfuromonadales bacterium]NIS44294.1 heavy-metal-associated domain-containing protein [Desulfuromonadales bacterium]
ERPDTGEESAAELDEAEVAALVARDEQDEFIRETSQERIRFSVYGMTCATCVGTVEKKLASLAGVVDVHVNLANETATVFYDASRLDQDDLFAAVNAAGYKPVADSEAT